jgi:fluoride exporter
MFVWVVNLITQPCVAIGIGGAIGCNARYGLSIWQKRFAWSADWPIATTLANLIGSLLIGMIAARIQDRGTTLYLLSVVGFCGGLTTFSSLALELLEHLQKGRWDRFAIEAIVNVVAGLALCYVGWKFSTLRSIP